ncbi:SCO4225 family membrane protein [Streptomyces sp. NPDC058637]|uniref:SCO4225 family membrane protein n=1 Tax=Streptomyces sp. NPDC058637 TaxID=3346569 RepID=UPI003652E25F
MVTRPDFLPLRSAGRALNTLAARLYLTACALLLVWAILAASEGSMALVLPFVATVPAGVVLLLVLPEGAAAFYLSIVLGALLNALVIGWCARALRRGRTPETAP